MRNDLNDQLARVREAGGLHPLPDPGFIQGFEPGAPPVPPYMPPAHDPDVPPEWLDPELDEPTADVPRATSPLIPRKPAPPPAPVGAWGGPAFNAQLVVVGTTAAWKGREVTLTDAEEKRIRAVVLTAMQNEVRRDLDAAGAPRTRRKSQNTPKATEPTGEAPKKRGRPRKVQP